MAKSNNYKRAYKTVSQPGTSLATGFFSGLSDSYDANKKAKALLAPKIMEIQSRYQLEEMKQKQKSNDLADKQTQNEKRDLQKQLFNIQKYYKQRKFSIKEKIAAATDDDLFGGNQDGDSPKVKKLKDLYSEVEESESADTKDILDQLKKYYVQEQ